MAKNKNKGGSTEPLEKEVGTDLAKEMRVDATTDDQIVDDSHKTAQEGQPGDNHPNGLFDDGTREVIDGEVIAPGQKPEVHLTGAGEDHPEHADQRSGGAGGAVEEHPEIDPKLNRGDVNTGRPPIDTAAAQSEQQRQNQLALDRIQAEVNARAFADAQIRRQFEEREKLRPMPPITQSVTADVARPDEETEVWQFSRPCFIWAEPDETHPARHKVSFQKGLQNVPKSLTDNWYLKRVGKPYQGKVK